MLGIPDYQAAFRGPLSKGREWCLEDYLHFKRYRNAPFPPSETYPGFQSSTPRFTDIIPIAADYLNNLIL